MRKLVALVIASFAVAAIGCSSSLSLPTDDDGMARALSSTSNPDDVCSKLAAKSGACAWSQSATVGCRAALRNAANDLTIALDACLAKDNCDDARACLDAALVGSATPASEDGSAGDGGTDAPADAPTIPDDATTTPPPDTSTGPVSCTHSVPFASATCKTCMDTSCCGESAICGKSQACLDLLTCVFNCDGDLSCEASCKSVRASTTISAFDDLRSCRNASCTSTCPTF